MQPKSARAVADSDGSPLFIAVDVMAAIGYPDDSDVTEALKHIPHEWRTSKRIRTPDGFQELDVLTEQGLYFFMGPHLAE